MRLNNVPVSILQHTPGSDWVTVRGLNGSGKTVCKLADIREEEPGEIQVACEILQGQHFLAAQVDSIPMPENVATLIANSRFTPKSPVKIAKELGCDVGMVMRLLAVTMNRGINQNMVIPGHFVEMVHKIVPAAREAWMRNGPGPIQGFDDKYLDAGDDSMEAV